jgi:uncharacterized protein YcaQ
LVRACSCDFEEAACSPRIAYVATLAGRPVIARIAATREKLSSLLWEQGNSVIYKGVEYTVMPTEEPDIWEWRFQIGDKSKTGRTQTRLAALAAKRVQAKIDAALRAAKSAPTGPAN